MVCYPRSPSEDSSFGGRGNCGENSGCDDGFHHRWSKQLCHEEQHGVLQGACTTTIQAFFISTLPKDHEAFGLPVEPPQELDKAEARDWQDPQRTDALCTIAEILGRSEQRDELVVLQRLDIAQRRYVAFLKYFAGKKNVPAEVAVDGSWEFESDMSQALTNVDADYADFDVLVKAYCNRDPQPEFVKTHNFVQRCASFDAVRKDMVKKVTEHWHAMATSFKDVAADEHPSEAEWTEYIINNPETDKIKSFCADPKLIGIGKYAKRAGAYLTALDSSHATGSGSHVDASVLVTCYTYQFIYCNVASCHCSHNSVA